MLVIHKQKKLLFSSIATIMTVSVLGLVFNRTISVNHVSALTYTIPEGYTTIVDENFYDCAANTYISLYPGANINNGLTDAQLAQITSLNCNKNAETPNEEKIFDVTGIEKMTGLTSLSLAYNHLYTLDLSYNTALTQLDVDNNYITNIDISNNTALSDINVSYNNLIDLTLSNPTALTKLDANHNVLTDIELSNATSLTELHIYNNQIESLDVTHNTLLTRLIATSNRLTSLDVSQNTALVMLNVFNNQLTTLNVSNNTVLERLIVSNNQLTSLNISQNTALIALNVSGNQLTSLDISHNTALSELHIYSTQITALDASSNSSLARLYADDILIWGNIEVTSTQPDIEIDISGLSFWRPSQSISDTENYTFDSADKTVTVGNPSGTNGYVQIVSTAANETYKLAIPNFLLFNTNNGTGNFGTLTCDRDFDSTECNVTLPTTEPTRSNYHFLGWSDSADATSADYQTGETITLDLSKTIYAVWSPIYTLDYNLNGGTGTFESQTCYPATTDGNCSTNTSANIPVSEGYYFLGWADAADSTSADYAPNSQISLSSNKTIYAVWAPIYTLSYNLNNGSGTFEPQTCHPNTTDGNCSIDIPSNTPLRSGYNFLGWTNASTASEVDYAAGTSLTMNSNKTIHAVWSKIVTTLTLSFDLNSGTGTFNDVTCDTDIDHPTCTAIIPNATPIKNGYTFLGWADSGTALEADYDAGDEITLSENKTVYAVWEIITIPHVLSFNLSDGEGDINAVTCYTDINHPTCVVTIPNNTPTKEGYNFLGWANSDTATTADYNPGAEVTLSGDKTVYAVWDIIYITQTLNFDSNGGESTVNSISCNTDIDHPTCNVNIPNTAPSRNGYAFLGWANSDAATEAEYTTGDEIILSSDKTLFAVWEIVYTTHTLSFDLNGGEGEISNLTCDTDINHPTCIISIPAYEPIRENYTFIGWANTATATNADYDSDAQITISADKILYAVWKADHVEPEPEPVEPDDEEIVVPDTSVTPDTGMNTKIEENNAQIVLVALPVTIATLISGFYISRNRKNYTKID